MYTYCPIVLTSSHYMFFIIDSLIDKWLILHYWVNKAGLTICYNCDRPLGVLNLANLTLLCLSVWFLPTVNIANGNRQYFKLNLYLEKNMNLSWDFIFSLDLRLEKYSDIENEFYAVVLVWKAHFIVRSAVEIYINCTKNGLFKNLAFEKITLL